MNITSDLKVPGRFTIAERDGKFVVVAPDGTEEATRNNLQSAQKVADAANAYLDKYNAERDGQFGRLK